MAIKQRSEAEEGGITQESSGWRSRGTHATNTWHPSPLCCNLLPILTPSKIVTSTRTASPEMSAGGPRSLASNILPRIACAHAERVPRCQTNVIKPRNPPSFVLVCVQSRDIRAVEILADTVEAAGVTVAVTRLDGLIREFGGTAVSAVVSWGDGVKGLSIGRSRGGGIRTLSP